MAGPTCKWGGPYGKCQGDDEMGYGNGKGDGEMGEGKGKGKENVLLWMSVLLFSKV